MTDTAGVHRHEGPPDEPDWASETWRRSAPALPGTVPIAGSRAERAADAIAELATTMAGGERLGSKEDVRRLCHVSVGTINEAIKLAQERGVITSRPGPGGGIFVLDPSPLTRMNGWFRAAATSSASLAESIQIRDALAPLLVEQALTRLTDADRGALTKLLEDVREAQGAGDLARFIWSAWEAHEYFARLGPSTLLDSLYLSIMDVGTSHLRAAVEGAPRMDETPVWFDDFADNLDDFVTALCAGDTETAVTALRRTDPTMVLRPPADDSRHRDRGRSD